MPTYEYTCDACEKSFELEQRISEDPIKDCQLCGKPAARRMISGGAGFQLKGGGWYADGYGTPKPSTSTSDKAEPKKSDDGGSAKTGSGSSESSGSSSPKSAD